MCPSRLPFAEEPYESSIFASLSASELRDVEWWLLSQESLALTPRTNATLQGNYIFYIDAMPPVKAEALAYLDGDGPRPARYAHVVLYLCAEEQVWELKVTHPHTLPHTPPYTHTHTTQRASFGC
jgi:hypothetical protein